jgi:hypothetical protein
MDRHLDGNLYSSPPQNGTVPISPAAGDIGERQGIDARLENSGMNTPGGTSPPLQAAGNIPNSPAEPVAGARRTYPLSMLLLFGSIGLNIYLSWIAVDTYNRYQDLVSDMRATRARRDHGESDRYADDSLEATTY